MTGTLPECDRNTHVRKTLDARRSAIELVSVTSHSGVERTVVFAPDGKEKCFLKRCEQYATEKTRGRRTQARYQDLVH